MTKSVGSTLSYAATYAGDAVRMLIAAVLCLDELSAFRAGYETGPEQVSTAPNDIDIPDLVEKLTRLAEHLQHSADEHGHREVRRRVNARRARS